MLRINPIHASHKLNVIPSTRLLRQKVRRFHPDRHQAIQAEVDNLLKEGFIGEIKYQKWLANVVVVPKKDSKWIVCVDYTYLIQACPKDSFPLPRIDQIVDTSAGHGMLSFLDAFSRYHQMLMHPSDAEKIAFITPHGLFYYNVMSFGLKNVGATYQRLVTKMFMPLLGKTIEVYINDMLVKSQERPDHAEHLQEAFELLNGVWYEAQSLKVCLQSRCGPILRFHGDSKGIEANSAQLRAIFESPAPASRKGVQQFIGRLATLGWFIS